MSTNTIDSVNSCTPEPMAAPTLGRKPAHDSHAPRKVSRAKKASRQPKGDRTNKKAEVIEMMKRVKGATLAEIMKATGWQPHTARGFASIPGQQGRREDRVA